MSAETIGLFASPDTPTEAYKAVHELLVAFGLTLLERDDLRRLEPTADSTGGLLLAARQHCRAVVIVLTGEHFGVPVHQQASGQDVRLSGGASVQASSEAIALCAASGAHLGRAAIPVVVGDVYVPADIRALRPIALTDTVAARDAVLRRLAELKCAMPGQALGDWQSAGDLTFVNSLPQQRYVLDAPPSRVGAFTEFVVDSGLSRDLSEKHLISEALDRLRKKRPIDLKYHYVGWKMAHHWVDLSETASYGHAELAALYKRSILEVAAAAQLSEEIHLVSLGPGNGQTDLILLQEFKEAVGVGVFFLIDISIELLILAVNRVISSGAVGGRSERTGVKAIMLDFEANFAPIASLLEVESRPPHVFAMVGYTFGNSNEDNLLSQIVTAMEPDDILVLDVRLHQFGSHISTRVRLSPAQEEALLRPYASEKPAQFAFGPVEELSEYTVRYSDLGAGGVTFIRTVAVGADTPVPSAINVFLSCQGLYGHAGFRSKIGLDHLDQLTPRTRLKEERAPLHLAKATYYDFGSLLTWFPQRGLEVVWKDAAFQDGVGIGLVALRRS